MAGSLTGAGVGLVEVDEVVVLLELLLELLEEFEPEPLEPELPDEPELVLLAVVVAAATVGVGLGGGGAGAAGAAGWTLAVEADAEAEAEAAPDLGAAVAADGTRTAISCAADTGLWGEIKAPARIPTPRPAASKPVNPPARRGRAAAWAATRRPVPGVRRPAPPGSRVASRTAFARSSGNSAGQRPAARRSSGSGRGHGTGSSGPAIAGGCCRSAIPQCQQ